MRPLRRSASFLARAAACCAAVYVVLLPLRDSLVRAIALAAGASLWLVDRPSVITGLAADGAQITIYTHLAGVAQPIGAWSGESLPVFLVAALGVALAVPAPTWWRRVELVLASGLAAVLVTIATAAIQLQVATVNYAHAALGLALVTSRGRALLEAANQAINAVMLLLPAAVLVVGYAASRVPGTPAAPRGAWRRPALLALAAVAVGTLLAALVLLRVRSQDPAQGLQRVLALNPRAPHAWFALAAHSVSVGRDRRALELYQRGLELAPDDAVANFQAGNLLYAAGRYADAAARYARVLAVQPGDPDARYNLGNALYSAGDLRAAAQAWEELLRRAPRHAAGHENLATAYLELGRPCDALPLLERAAELRRPEPLDPRLQQQVVALVPRCPR
ncbi:MAG: tetratricopeptide repeat protein [Thermodesulfobacteriota bacterium]